MLRRLALVTTIVVVTAPALAQKPASPPTATKCTRGAVECGKLAFEAGVKAYEDGDWALALELFREALGLRPHAAIAFNVGLAEAKNGLFVEAVAHFDRVISDPDAPEALKQKAVAERDKADKAIASVVVDSPPNTQARVMLDGDKLEGDPPMIRVNPGPHRLLVGIEGRSPVARELTLLPGETLRITIDHSRELPVLIQPPTETVAPPAQKPLSTWWFFGAAGATAIVSGVTIWSGLDTQRAFSDYERDFPFLSQQAINERVSMGNGKETRTNVLIAMTGAMALGTAAIGIFAVEWDGKEKAATVQATGNGVSIRGRF